MKNSLLQLRALVFTKVNIEAHDRFAPGGTLNTSAGLEGGVDTANPRHYLLQMTVKFVPAEGTIGPYAGEVVAKGEFFVAPECPDEMIAKVALINGASILYGSIREMVAMLTGRGQWGPIMLATMTFTDAPERASIAEGPVPTP